MRNGIPPGYDVPPVAARVFNKDNPPPLGPESTLGLLGEWFRRKNRGRNALLSEPAIGPQNLLESIGEDALACGVTIACHVDQVNGDPNDRPSVLGRVRWGTDGANHEAEFDFVNGVQLNVAGSYVELTAQIDPDAPGNGVIDGGSFKPVNVFATLSYLPPSSRTPVRTRYLAFAGAGALSISVPAFARDFVALKSVAAVTLQVEQLDRAGTTVVLEGPSAAQIAEVLANDCRTLRITASAATLVRVVFSLYL